MSNDSVGRVQGSPGVAKPAARDASVPQSVVNDLSSFVNDDVFRKHSPRGIYQALPTAVQEFFYGDRLLKGETIGIGHQTKDGNAYFLYPYYGNVGSDAGHVVGVARTPDGLFVPLKGTIENTWFGRTAALQLEPAGRAYTKSEAGALLANLTATRKALFSGPAPTAPGAATEAPAQRPAAKPSSWSTESGGGWGPDGD